MKSARIHNLDTLEKEIYRLKLHRKKLEDRMDDNFNYLKNNYARMAKNSFTGNKENLKEALGAGIKGSFVFNEKMQNVIDKIVNHLADKANEGIDVLIDKLFKRDK